MPFIDPELIERDRKLQVLRSPQEYTDEEVYGALSALSGGKTEKSSVILREPERGRHLFAEVWRYMSLHYMDDGWDIFTACFGKMKKFPWHPLANAVYLDREERGETVYEINACRKFVYKSGQWSEMRYDELFFDKYRIGAIMHEADRQLRRYLKTGHYLREKAGEEWIAPYVEAVIEADREAAAEAAKPRITIDLSGLDKIRRDAQITRDSLLTEEEMREQETVETKPETPVIEAPAIIPDREETAVQPEASEPFNLSVENDKKSVHEEPGTVTIEIPSLDEVHAQILLMLMRGESPAGLIRKEFLMPSVVTDTINEALFDEIGDNVLECDGDEIALVETVGRKSEIEALLHDVDIITEGGASFRFIVGRYGSGKSFLIQTIRNYVMDRNFIVADADLSPERRLQGTKGQGLATYRELIGNLSTKTKPEGGALTLVLDRWINSVQMEAARETGLMPGDPGLTKAVDARIYAVTSAVSELVHGFEFARLLSAYYHAYVDGNDDMKMKVVRWFRGEYALKREAREELGINIIITDDDWYDYLKIFATFFRLAGYSGLMIMIDELVNIYKIPNSITRQYNYEKMLTMYNDTLQGKAHYLGIIMGATPQALEDKRRGIYSYEALRSRLAEGKFSRPGARDLLAPVIRLEPLTAEEMLVLCEKLADMHADLYGYQRILTTDDLVPFIKMEYGRIGADQNITPREVIRDFIELLDIMYQNPGTGISELMESEDFSFAKSDAVSDKAEKNYAEFEI